MPDFNEYRDYLYDDFEFRQDAETGLGIVTGTIVKYGDVATFPWGTEEVKAAPTAIWPAPISTPTGCT